MRPRMGLMQTPPWPVTDLRTLFLNFQHLLNTFRPHEAREELIGIVTQQTAAKRELIDQLDAACKDALEEAGGGEPSELDEPAWASTAEAEGGSAEAMDVSQAPEDSETDAAAGGATTPNGPANQADPQADPHAALARLLATLDAVPWDQSS